jgi:hypothetical protein
MKFEFTQFEYVYGIPVPIEVEATHEAGRDIRVLRATLAGVPKTRVQLAKFSEDYRIELEEVVEYMQTRTEAVLADYDEGDY